MDLALDAAIVMAGERGGWDKVTPSRVSSATGLGRVWLSRHFPGGSKGIQDAVVVREAARLVNGMESIPRHLTSHSLIRAAISVIVWRHTPAEMIAIWELADARKLLFSDDVFWAMSDAICPTVRGNSADIAACWSGLILRHIVSRRPPAMRYIVIAMKRAADGYVAKTLKGPTF